MDTLTGAVVLIVSINDELSKDVRTQPVDWDKYIVNIPVMRILLRLEQIRNKFDLKN